MAIGPRRGNSSLAARIALDGGEEIRKELADLGRTGEQAFRKLQNAARQLQVGGGLEASLQRMERSLRNISAQAGRLGTAFTTAGRFLSTRLTLPIVALGVQAVRSFNSIEGALANVSTLIDTSVESVSDMRAEFIEIGRRVPVSFDELGGALYNIRSAGIAASDAMTVLERSAQLAVAGLGTTAQAADIATSAINTWGLRGADAARVFDTLFKTVRNGKTTIAELSQGFGAVAATVREAGVSVDEFFAAVAALTTTGLPASVAFTQIRAAIVAMTKPSEKLDEIMTKLGVKTFRELIQREGGMVAAFRAIRDAAGGTQEELNELFGRVEGVSAVLGLTGNNAEAFAKTLEDITNGQDALTSAFLARTEELDSRLQQFRNNLNIALAEIGRVLEPTILAVIDVIEGLLESFDKLDDGSKKLIVAVGGLAAALGPLFIVIGGSLAILRVAAGGFADLLAVLRRFNNFLGLNFGVGLTTFLAKLVLRLGQIAGFVGFFIFLKNLIGYETKAAQSAREHAEAMGRVKEAVDSYLSGADAQAKALAEEARARINNARAAAEEAAALQLRIQAMLAERRNTPVGLLSPEGANAEFEAEALKESIAARQEQLRRLDELEAELDRAIAGNSELAESERDAAAAIQETTKAKEDEIRVFRGGQGLTVQSFGVEGGVARSAGELIQLREGVKGVGDEADKTKEKLKQVDDGVRSLSETERSLSETTQQVAQANEQLGSSAEAGIAPVTNVVAGLKNEVAAARSEIIDLGDELDLADSITFPEVGPELDEVVDNLSDIGTTGDKSFTTLISRTVAFQGEINLLTRAINNAIAALRRLGNAKISGPKGSVDGLATGGLFRGRGGIDTNLALLTDKEYVISAPAVRAVGVGFLDWINSMRGKLSGFDIPGFASGGFFEANGPSPRAHLSGGGSLGQMTVNFDIGGQVIGPFTTTGGVAREVVEAAKNKAHLSTLRKPLRRRG